MPNSQRMTSQGRSYSKDYQNSRRSPWHMPNKLTKSCKQSILIYKKHMLLFDYQNILASVGTSSVFEIALYNQIGYKRGSCLVNHTLSSHKGISGMFPHIITESTVMDIALCIFFHQLDNSPYNKKCINPRKRIYSNYLHTEGIYFVSYHNN